jgi:LPXTG-motif cell wall-anchored protein
MSPAGKDGPSTRKLFLALFGLAGLGVGVWLFRSRRRRRGRPRRRPG